MILPYQHKQVMQIAEKEPLIWNKTDRKDFRYLFYLATVATNHTWNNLERIRLRQLKRKYGGK